MEDIKKLVGIKLKELRKRAGYNSTAALADKLDVQTNTIGAYERGESWISPELLPQLAEVLDVPMAAFYPGFDKQMEPTPEEALAVLANAIRTPVVQQLRPTPTLELSHIPSDVLQGLASAGPQTIETIAGVIKSAQATHARIAAQRAGQKKA